MWFNLHIPLLSNPTLRSLPTRPKKKEGGNNDDVVCVTGGAGYIGSCLVKKLLEKGYTVHATLRNLDDPIKVGLLKSLLNADTRLKLFKADIYNPHEFESAIRGCKFVFHVATPFQHIAHSSSYKHTSEAAVAGVKAIMDSCVRSGTVRRLIYTASVMAASPLKEDSTGFKCCIDESCWTPSNLSFAYCNDFTLAYTHSKTLAEKEALSYIDKSSDGLEVVTLPCGLVGGETLLSYIPVSVGVLISQLTGNLDEFNTLLFLHELLGSVPIVHVDDVCEAHIFCINEPSIQGRFLCATGCLTIAEMANLYREINPQLSVQREFMEGPERGGIRFGSTKLIDIGFEYKYDTRKILEESLQCGRRMGILN
uniref:NAD-dependent epimerase/dehydratase domain-containing protein n=1 Tax=Nelumbo nucifera TaxID=4432 RepID=A0A822YUU2_NELNU|nr:TPA_asm: hypothetical protein HUJ06_006958 [Nelumbo nucifera]